MYYIVTFCHTSIFFKVMIANLQTKLVTISHIIYMNYIFNLFKHYKMYIILKFIKIMRRHNLRQQKLRILWRVLL